MILVMHWAVKQQRLAKLVQANHISLSIDDRKDYRVLRFRCSMPCPVLQQDTSGQESRVQGPDTVSHRETLEDWCSASVLACEGILGVCKVAGDVPENTLESHDIDKSEAMSKSIPELLRRACQNPDGTVDSEALNRITKNVRHFASDQGPSVAKAGKLLVSGGTFPNLVYLSFDPAHQVRIASKDPLQALPDFEKQWCRLFSGKNALLPAIHHSKVWQSKLLACQNEVLKVHGTQGGISRAVQSLSHAPHRFDSAATPLFKFCALVRAIALLCGMQAADAAW